MKLSSFQKDMIKDLVKKFPKGESGNLKKSDYDVTFEYSDHYGRYKSNIQLSPEKADKKKNFWGYSPESLWSLGDGKIALYKAREIVSTAFDGSVSSIALTRRSNRLIERLEKGFSYIRQNGSKGTWKISWGYQNTAIVFVNAPDRESASAASSVLSGLFGHDFNSDCSIRFVNIEGPEKTQKRNEDLSLDITGWLSRKVSQLERELVEARGALKRAQDAAARLSIATSVYEESQVERN